MMLYGKLIMYSQQFLSFPYQSIRSISTVRNFGDIMQQNKIYVGNFPYTVDESQLRELFSPYGEIEDLALIMDRATGRPKGFAFITFSAQQSAEKALEQNGKNLGGRPLKVNMATEKPSRGGRSGGSGGGGNRSRW
jgi:RNA recognition motif-containing protein